jgi:hypothetical protein
MRNTSEPKHADDRHEFVELYNPRDLVGGCRRRTAHAGLWTAMIINDPLHHQAFSRSTRPAALVKHQKTS